MVGEHDACLEQLSLLFEERPGSRKGVAEDDDFESMKRLPEYRRLVEGDAEPRGEPLGAEDRPSRSRE